jgi:hypothetical protein
MTFAVGDAALKETKALPNGAATIVSTGIDLGIITGGMNRNLGDYEGLIQAPALVVGDLANAATMKYTVQGATDAAFTSPIAIFTDLLTQTGAGGVGAAAAEVRYRLPVNHPYRYVRVQAINSGAGDASDKSLTHKLVF